MWFYLVGFILLCIPVFGEIVYLTGLRLHNCCKPKMPERTQRNLNTSIDPMNKGAYIEPLTV